MTVLPTLSLSDIPKQIAFTDSEVKMIGNVKVHFYDQPTNGISYIRLKCNLKKMPEELRLFVPMFGEFLSDIGTKNYRYDVFNNKMLSCTSGLKVQLDTYSNSKDHENIHDRNEQMLISTGFLDRNIDSAFEVLTELLATPNFDEHQNISDLIKMESINKANNLGNKGLQYARSYAASGLKAHARSFESFRSDIFFCQYAAEVLKTSNPAQMLTDATNQFTEIASYLFREENLEIAIHGSKAKQPLIQMKIELMLNALKNENSRYSEKHNDIIMLNDFKDGQIMYKNFFKSPLQVNMCSEAMIGPTILNEDDYAAMLILQEVATYVYLHTSVREKGGAYGAGCAVNDSGIISMYSYRDPNCDATYDHFERAIAEIIEGKFSERELVESKLLAFQKLDKVVEPSLRGLVQFTRGYSDEQKMRLRLKALEVTKDDLVYVAEKYMMSAIEKS